MKSEVREMLEDLYGIVSERFPEPVEAWDHFVEFVAAENDFALFAQIDHQFEWLFGERSFEKKFLGAYDPVLVRSDYYDHLGEMYQQKLIAGRPMMNNGRVLLPWEQVQKVVRLSVPECEDKITVVDHQALTGRLLMAAYKRAPNANLFGADPDIRAMRIAYANFSIHGIKGYLLHADSHKHDLRFETEDGRHNWGFANRWDSHMDELHPKAKYEASA